MLPQHKITMTITTHRINQHQTRNQTRNPMRDQTNTKPTQTNQTKNDKPNKKPNKKSKKRSQEIGSVLPLSIVAVVLDVSDIAFVLALTLDFVEVVAVVVVIESSLVVAVPRAHGPCPVCACDLKTSSVGKNLCKNKLVQTMTQVKHEFTQDASN
jgi:hypothetical protein